MFKNKTLRIIFFITAALGIWSYFAGLSIDVTRDAGKYATVSKEIFQNGNLINLTVHDDPYDQKPPLLFWLGALGFAIGTISNFWFKFPVLLVVIFGFYSAYRLGKSLYNRRVGLITVFFLVCSFIYALYSMDIHTDTPLQAFVTFALWQLFEFIKTKKNIHWILGFFGIGLAMLSKGPIGAAIPAFAVAGHLLLKKDFKSLLDYRWYAGILLALVVSSPALIGLMNQFGWDGLVFFFWENNVGRITGTYVKASGDVFFYVHSLAYLFLPWSLLFFIAAFREIKWLIKRKFKSAEFFTFTGIWIYFLILSISQSQLPNYIFIIIPLIAVLTAKWTDIAIQEEGKLQRVFVSVQNTVTILLWISIGLLVFYLFPAPPFYYFILAGFGIACTIFILTKEKSSAGRILLAPALGFIFLFLLLNTHIFPYMFGYQAPPKAARYFTKNAGPNETLYNFHYPQYELFFYSEPQARQIDSVDEMKQVAGKNGNWIFTDKQGFEIIEDLDLDSDTIIEYHHLYLNRGAKFINPKTRDEVLKPMYLIKY
ncbi:MAG: ArnT family glycosyltransferase [Prolixibacteraceae bacterium]